MLIPVFRLDTPADHGLKAIAFTLHGLNNRTSSACLQRRLHELRAAFDTERGAPVQQGFSAMRQQVGRQLCSMTPTPQALFDLYQARGRLPSVSPLVDLYSQWSLNSGLSISAHDLKHLRLPVTLALSRGGESFQMRQNLPPVVLPPGEYVYFDGRGQVLSRMESLQSSATAVHAETRSALLIIQGHAQTDSSYLYDIAERLKADLLECCGKVCRPEVDHYEPVGEAYRAHTAG